MIRNVRIIQLASAAIAACGLLAGAPASAQGVKIGILNDQSGVYADYGGKGSIEAAKMAIEDFGGSVLGQKIDLVTADHQNKPDLAGNIARRWYDSEGVDMITDLTTSSVALAVQGIAAEKKKIDIVVGAVTSAITGAACTPYGFLWARDTHALAVSTGGALVKTGGDTWYFITVDYAFGHAMEEDASAVIEAGGGKVLGHVLYPSPRRRRSSPTSCRGWCCSRPWSLPGGVFFANLGRRVKRICRLAPRAWRSSLSRSTAAISAAASACGVDDGRG